MPLPQIALSPKQSACYICISLLLGQLQWTSRRARDVAAGLVVKVLMSGIRHRSEPIAKVVDRPERTVPKPIFLCIPAIGVRTRVVGPAMATECATGAPSSAKVARWCPQSARPGAIGPAIIRGRADGPEPLGVFARLKDLRPGDVVYVVRANASIVKFMIATVRLYRTNAIPAEAVNGALSYPAIRLITWAAEAGDQSAGDLSYVMACGYRS